MNPVVIKKSTFKATGNRSPITLSELPEIRVKSLPAPLIDDSVPSDMMDFFISGRLIRNFPTFRPLRSRRNFAFTNNRQGSRAPENKFNIIHDYYKLMIEHKDAWYKENPCATCDHDLHGHFKYIKHCRTSGCGCNEWKNTSLKKYTNGMYESKWYNFRWRFRNNNVFFRL